MSLYPRARVRILPRLLVLALAGIAVWVAHQDQSREAVVMLAITLGTPLLAAVRQLRVSETGTPARREEWVQLVQTLVLLTAAIALAVILPWAAVSVAVGADALVFLGDVIDEFRSCH
ncbi:hypothetical protein [Mycobacterium sp.]|uniref:hypothetical protein n=1 Tax=Mycobacterium sp. TaxID=1785 RepID=UPI003D11B33B